jgi:formate/nitrite transporter FocA (FNT family)
MTSEPSRNGLSSDEQEEAIRRSAPRAAVVFEAIRHEAVEELARRNPELFWSGFAAGLSMGFSFVAEALLHAALPDVPWRPLVAKFGYSIGFLIVILGRQQLFTENTLTPVIHVLRERRLAVLWEMFRLWGVVLAANILATMLFGVGLYLSGLFDTAQTTALRAIAVSSVADGFGTTLLSAVFAGWLIALMVWLLPVAASARVTVIILITYLVGLGSFSHIIAGSTLVFYALAADATSLTTALGSFFVPTLLGNIIGGVAFVAALNYAQVSPGD